MRERGAPGRTGQLSPWAPSLSLVPAALSVFLTVGQQSKGRGKRFPKKVDCQEAVGFRPRAPAGLCSAPLLVALHLQSKLGSREGGSWRLPAIRQSFLLSAFLTLVRRLRSLKLRASFPTPRGLQLQPHREINTTPGGEKGGKKKKRWRGADKTTLPATRLALLRRASPAPALTHWPRLFPRSLPRRKILLAQPLPKIVGLRSWENTCQGARACSCGRGKLDLKGSPEATD